MTENKNVELVEVPELTQRDKVDTYIRSTFLLGSFNFERMQSIGFAVSMILLHQERRPGGGADPPPGVLQHPAVGCILDYGCDRCDGA